MKRAFLFGLTSFLMFAAFGALMRVGQHKFGSEDFYAAVILVAIVAALSFVAFRFARAAPPNKSLMHAVGGWVAGFIVIVAGILSVTALVSLR